MPLRLIIASLMLIDLFAFGQGTFALFDQQSSTNETPLAYGSGSAMQQLAQPWGQSFTPSLSSIQFIRLNFVDGNTIDGLGATVFVNLRSESISGPIIGTTSPVTMPNLFRGVSTFLFASAMNLTPGTTYYFDPVVSGGTWNIIGGPYDYAGGTAFVGGAPFYGGDFWFREGIFVPEPSSVALLALAGACAFSRRMHGKKTLPPHVHPRYINAHRPLLAQNLGINL